jgi:glyoxylase-like metal-dependent hydrolase (beta-lactamase superfamily II)
MSAATPALAFNTVFDPRHGEAVTVTPDGMVARVTAPNAGPFTFHGTNSYLIGASRLVIIDPGPDNDDRHFQALLRGIDGRPVDAILVTHTHIDHSPLAKRLKAVSGAPIMGAAPHFAFRALAPGETNLLDASGDHDYQPDRVLTHADSIASELGPISVIETPGHTANHLCFAADEAGLLFSGDHVMGWSTSIVAPPDGQMAPYMASLDRLIARNASAKDVYLPGHGDRINEPSRFVRGLRTHRRQRARSIAAQLTAEGISIPQIVAALYSGLDPRLRPAAALSVFAHLEELIDLGEARAIGGAATLSALYVRQ